MDSTIIVAFVVGGFGALSAWLSAKYVSNVNIVRLQVKMDELEKKVTKHNNLVERQYKVENRVSMLEVRLHDNE